MNRANEESDKCLEEPIYPQGKGEQEQVKRARVGPEGLVA